MSRKAAPTVDLDATLLATPPWLPGAQANPNVGRPMVGGGSGDHDESYFTHENYQLTGAYSLKFEDIMPESKLAKVLGFHDFTALAGRYRTEREDRSAQLYAADPAFAPPPGVDSDGLQAATIPLISSTLRVPVANRETRIHPPRAPETPRAMRRLPLCEVRAAHPSSTSGVKSAPSRCDPRVTRIVSRGGRAIQRA